MQFTKLFNSILDSTIWQEPVETKVVWITMLAMVDMRGEVQSSIPGLAKRAGVTLEQVEQALECFRSPDKYSRTQDHEGRRVRDIAGGWELLNHAKYRALLSAEERREYNRRKQAEYREAAKKVKKPVNDVSMTVNDNVSCAHITDTDTDTENNSTPLTPQGGNEVVKKRVLPTGWERWPLRKQKTERVNYNNKIMGRIGKFFNQRETTLWTVADAGTLSKIAPEEQDVALMEQYYLAPSVGEHDIRRKDLPTLLNNWNGELNRANVWKCQGHE